MTFQVADFVEGGFAIWPWTNLIFRAVDVGVFSGGTIC